MPRLSRSHYRWTELRLLALPAVFMTLGLTTLLVVRGQQIDLAARTLPPLDAFTPVIGLLLALFGAHFALNFIAPDADQTLLPIAGMLSSIGVLMALRLGPDLGQSTLGSKQLVFVIVGLVLCVLHGLGHQRPALAAQLPLRLVGGGRRADRGDAGACGTGSTPTRPAVTC